MKTNDFGPDAMASLPHGPEFRFLDKVSRLVPGQEAAAEYRVRGDEFFLRGHFPGDPIFPGVLMIEAAAQLAGIVAQSDPAIPPPGRAQVGRAARRENPRGGPSRRCFAI